MSAIFSKEDENGKEIFGNPQYANSEIMTVSPLTLEDVVRNKIGELLTRLIEVEQYGHYS